MALGGCAVGYAVVRVLLTIATPAFGRYIRPVALADDLERLQALAAGNPRVAITVAWATLLVGALALPFLFNRTWWSRGALTRVGVPKIIVGAVLVGALEALVSFITSSAGATGGVLATTVPGGQIALAGPLVQLGGQAVATALLFIILGELTLGGPPDRWRSPWWSGRGILGWSLAGLAAGAALAALAGHLAPRLQLLLNASLELLNESAEISSLGLSRVRLGMLVGCGLLGAAAGGLLVACSPSRAGLRRRLIALGLAALPAAALLAVGTWFTRHCLEAGEMKVRTLAAAAGVAERGPERRMLLGAPGGARVVRFPTSVEVLSGTQAQRVAATPASEAALREYLSKRAGRWTVHTAPAWQALATIPDRLLEPEHAIREQLAATAVTRSLLFPQLLAFRLRRMPLTPAVRAAGLELLDESRFRAGPDGKAKLAQVALNLGDLARARVLWKQARDGGYRPDGTVSAPEALPPRDGAIRGRVFLGEQPAVRLRVALYYSSKGRPLDRPPTDVSLLAATSTDEGGAFVFQGLGAEPYVLGVLLPAELKGPVRASGSLGPLDLARGVRQPDLGVLRIEAR